MVPSSSTTTRVSPPRWKGWFVPHLCETHEGHNLGQESFAISVWIGNLKQMGNPLLKPNVHMPGFLVHASDSCWQGLTSKILFTSKLKLARAIKSILLRKIWRGLEWSYLRAGKPSSFKLSSVHICVLHMILTLLEKRQSHSISKSPSFFDSHFVSK